VVSNPFSTRFIRPGAIRFLFPDGESAALLVQRLRENRWGGQIIGPHGSGKSTLLATLKPELETAGRQVLWITLHQGERRLPALDRRSLGPTTQLVIDGYEQLSWWTVGTSMTFSPFTLDAKDRLVVTYRTKGSLILGEATIQIGRAHV